MLQDLTVTGMILSVQPIGEYDRRVVLLTKEKGKISAFAKGARRQGSSLLAATAPFCFGTFTVYEGRSSYTIRHADIQNYFEALRMDLEGAWYGMYFLEIADTWYGMYFLEIADFYGRENNDESQMLNLLFVTLKAVEKSQIDRMLIRNVFELKAMVLNGEYPDFFQCVNCGSEEGICAIFSTQDGVACQACAKTENQGVLLDESSLYTLQYIVYSDLRKLYSFTVSPVVLEKVRRVVTLCRGKYIGKTFQAEKLLEEVQQ